MTLAHSILKSWLEQSPFIQIPFLTQALQFWFLIDANSVTYILAFLMWHLTSFSLIAFWVFWFSQVNSPLAIPHAWIAFPTPTPSSTIWFLSIVQGPIQMIQLIGSALFSNSYTMLTVFSSQYPPCSNLHYHDVYFPCETASFLMERYDWITFAFSHPRLLHFRCSENDC